MPQRLEIGIAGWRPATRAGARLSQIASAKLDEKLLHARGHVRLTSEDVQNRHAAFPPLQGTALSCVAVMQRLSTTFHHLYRAVRNCTSSKRPALPY
jgi:hypothetical protein